MDYADHLRIPAKTVETIQRRIPWLRVVSEGAVIVASILLAFGIDAWWDGTKERREESLVLDALRVEFQQNVGSLRVIHAIHAQYAAEVGHLLDRVLAAEEGATLQIPDSLLRALVSFRTADPAMGTLNTLLASGRIGLIRSQDLRRALAGWPAAVEDASEDERLVRDFVHGQIIAGLSGDLDIGQLLASYSALTDSGRTQRTTAPQLYSLRVTSRSRALVAQRAHLARLLVGQSQDRLDAGDSILGLIDRELAARQH